MDLRHVQVTRYVTPLREGGSLPGLVEGEDDGLYVLKFAGAGQGPRALVAELVAGEIARALGLCVPELVVANLDPQLGDAEPDPEIKDLIAASPGVNLGVDFLPGALAFTPAAAFPDADLAADIVWFDTLVSNVDRTPRNPNLLRWHGRLWCIDHGAALYLQHDDEQWPLAAAARALPTMADHVLAPYASSILEADARLAEPLTPALVEEIAAAIPGPWLGEPDQREARRRTYGAYIAARMAEPRAFARDAEEARRGP